MIIRSNVDLHLQNSLNILEQVHIKMALIQTCKCLPLLRSIKRTQDMLPFVTTDMWATGAQLLENILLGNVNSIFVRLFHDNGYAVFFPSICMSNEPIGDSAIITVIWKPMA